MAAHPDSTEAHRAAMEAYGDALRRFLPVDPEGELVNRLVAFVEANGDVTRVAQVAAEFDLSERALQRLVHRRLGLTPKWLIQRRRLQEAAERLRDRSTTLGEVSAVLGYADQPHFIRDFSKVTSMTPGEFAALHAHGQRSASRGDGTTTTGQRA
jgi:AraC-like DNA-binding protein